jgi:putative phage-type endonuclease
MTRTIGNATEILPPGADRLDRQAWLEARRDGVTASEIAVILGLGKWNSQLSLFYDKLGALDEGQGNWLMSLGIALEPYILSLFTEITGIETTSAGLVRNRERPWQLATPDAVDGHIPVEAKTAQSLDDWGPSGSDRVPIAYRAQLTWQCDTLGADHGYLVVLPLRTGEPRWYDIPWDAEDAAVMREAAQEFLAMVEAGTPPPPDGSEATAQALKHVNPADADAPEAFCPPGLLRSYRAALRAESAALARKKLMENKIRVAMGTSVRMTGPDGSLVATRRVYERAGYVVQPTVVDALYASPALRDKGERE